MINKIYSSTLFLFLTFIPYSLFSQDLIDKLSNEICQCAQKKQYKKFNDIQPCFEDVLLTNFKKIKEFYKAETIEDINMDEIGAKIGARIVKNCQYIVSTFGTNETEVAEVVEKDPNLKCTDLKKGDFYYLSKMYNGQSQDTTFVTISNNMYLERMNNGRTFSLLSIEWKNDCAFELKFKESNDPMKKEFSEPGEIYKYEVLTNKGNSVFIKNTRKDKSYQFELIKIN